MLKNNRNKAIGVFDSGFGGLNILRGMVKKLPEYDFIYLGDAARVPYGTRSPETVCGFAQQAVDFLFKKNCALIIFACNTASGDALRRIQKEYLPQFYPGKKVLGVIIPAAEFAATKTENGKIGVMATEGAVSSGAFKRELLKINSRIKVFQNACPLLVPLVEAGEHNSEAADMFLKKYLKPLMNKGVDTLILGCTHYGILENKIQKIAGKNIYIVSEANIVAAKLKDYLKRHTEVEKKLTKNGQRIFYSTDLTENFKTLGGKFFGRKIKVEKAELN